MVLLGLPCLWGQPKLRQQLQGQHPCLGGARGPHTNIQWALLSNFLVGTKARKWMWKQEGVCSSGTTFMIGATCCSRPVLGREKGASCLSEARASSSSRLRNGQGWW